MVNQNGNSGMGGKRTEAGARLITVVLDGLRYQGATQWLGYVEHLVESGHAARYKVISELPSLSRPLYEVLLTGTPACENGITSNQVVRLSGEESIFHLAKNAGLITAAAAYHWVSELYNKAPFNPLRDRHQHDEQLPIMHGSFYFEDHYPDSHLFADAEFLRQTYNPDFLYVHSMNIDDAGHRFGGGSKEYEGSVRIVDSILALAVPQWIAAGYTIIITADHGMTVSGQHGGTTPEEREVALYGIGQPFEPGVYEEPIPQLAIAPLMAGLLDFAPSPRMKPTPIIPGLHVPAFGSV
ncbi:alkaline phosphatase family protein [Paenibacillus segetis]|uniref:Nucleotide pyrophosphatase n=1 Tax=Paenibacillus segetis TaxID=1325360 RepID=A0ABQ1YMN4_9BACL|nr:alkaline phosphatase family protein [Paenibacillus segetis]GGH31853.1 hypothetical protein GCM10008013_35870 [Paenibacillus segetis]